MNCFNSSGVQNRHFKHSVLPEAISRTAATVFDGMKHFFAKIIFYREFVICL